MAANQPQPELDEEMRSVIHYIAENREVSRSEIEKELSLNSTAAVRLLKKLKDSRKVAAVGKGKNTKYILTE